MLDKVDGSTIPVTAEEINPLPSAVLTARAEPKPSGGSRILAFIVKFFLIILQMVLMIAILAGSYFIAKRMIDEKPEPRKRRAFKAVYTIDTTIAKPGNHQPVFTAYGQTVAARTVDLRALVSGEIVRVNPTLGAGSSVAKGDDLVEISDFDYRGALAEAEANLIEAQARITESEAQINLERSRLTAAQEQAEIAEADLKRVEQLRRRQTATQQQVESRKLVMSQRQQAIMLSQDTIKVQQARIEQQKAALLRLQWRVDQAQKNLNSTVLKAPFSGIVRSSSAEIGRTLTANDVVVSMYEAGTLEVRFTVTDAQYGRLQIDEQGLIGRSVEVIWSVGGKEWKYPAVIDRLGAEITSTRGGVELFARVGETNTPVTIRPGAFVEVRVPDRLFRDTIIVPDTALYGTDKVYTVVDGELVENTVEIAAFEGENILVSAGLKADDKILVTRITEVSAGLRVRTEEEANAPKPAAPPATGERQGGAVASNTPAGRPSPEEVQKIIQANNLTLDKWRALPRPERRKMIAAHRASN